MALTRQLNKKIERAALNLFLGAVFISPLIFFTGLTRNPYLIQERVLQIFLVISLSLLLSGNGFKLKLPITFLDRPLWSFFLVALFSFLISFLRYPDFRSSFVHYGGRGILLFLFSALVPFYFSSALKVQLTEKVKKIVIAAGSIASAYALLQFFNSVIDSVNLDFIWGKTLDPFGARSISTFGNPNFLSAYLMIVVFWIIAYMFTQKKAKWVLLFILNISALAITMTRSTFAGLLLGLLLLLYALTSEYKNKYINFKKKILLTFGLIAAVGLSFFLISSQFRDRLEGMVSLNKMGRSLDQRLLIWESSAGMFIQDPVIGRGWGNFEIFYPFYQGRIVERAKYRPLRTHANNAHNFFLEIITQSGIIGGGVYIWLMAVFIYSSIKIFKESKGENKVWAAVFTSAAVAFWGDNILNVSLFFPMPALAFWINAGLLAGLGRRICKEPQRKINLNRFKYFFIVFFAAASGSVIYFNCIYFKSAVHFFSGFKASRSQQLQIAERELLKSWDTYPLIVDNNYELGNIYMRQAGTENSQKLERAVWAYGQALRANPGYDEIYYNLGVAHLMKEEPSLAERNFRKALKINPVSPNIYVALGDIAGRKNEYEKAREFYEKAISLGASGRQIYNNYGYYLERLGKVPAALGHYLSLLEYEDYYEQARSSIIRLKTIQRQTLKTEEKEEVFKRVDKYITGESWEKALDGIKEILDKNPASLKGLIYAGNIYVQLGRIEEAEEKYRMVLLIDPGNQTAKRNLEAVSR